MFEALVKPRASERPEIKTDWVSNVPKLLGLEAPFYDLRVIFFKDDDNQAVPEPLTILGALTSVGTASILKRQKRS